MKFCNNVNFALNVFFAVAMDTNEQVPLACYADVIVTTCDVGTHIIPCELFGLALPTNRKPISVSTPITYDIMFCSSGALYFDKACMRMHAY